jgi:hypothetical protein
MDNPQVRTFPKCKAPIHYTSLRPLLLGMPPNPQGLLYPPLHNLTRFPIGSPPSLSHKFFNWRRQTIRLGSYLIDEKLIMKKKKVSIIQA